MPIIHIAHVRTYDPQSGLVNCYRHRNDGDFFFTGTIQTNGTGLGTCRPSTRTFDIILANTSGVLPGGKLYIAYDDGYPGQTKPVTNVQVEPPVDYVRASPADCGEANVPINPSAE